MKQKSIIIITQHGGQISIKRKIKTIADLVTHRSNLSIKDTIWVEHFPAGLNESTLDETFRLAANICNEESFKSSTKGEVEKIIGKALSY